MKEAIIHNIDSLLELRLSELISKANEVRCKSVGSKLELCNILNAKSGSCSEDCKFCAQSSYHSAGVSTYSLKNVEEIVKAAQNAKEIGAQKFGVVTSGNRLTQEEINTISQAIREIKKTIDITICASLGALTREDMKMLKHSGLSLYHHNIETSPRFYPKIVSTHSFQQRLDTVKAAKDLGLEVCSGVLIGMGEDWQDRIDMVMLLKDLDVDSVPINFLVPIKGTPFESLPPISRDEAIRTICIFRIVLKDKVIKIAAGREAILKDFQSAGFTAGANGMLIGGYLTVKGNDLERDYKLIDEIKELWKE
ncbi:MAG: biotin synthase BioB [Candidatus Omnitrophota bacterium]|nr:biotin synthase BioB [Candidatus Omnitrophota bacterium]